MLLRSWLDGLRPTYRRFSTPTRSAPGRLQVEVLEDRHCPSGSYLLVPDHVNENVLRYDAATGAFVDEVIPRHSGGLNQPNGIVFGPHDHDLYITTGHFQGPGQIKAVLRFDGANGAFEDEFVEQRQMGQPHSGIFGPDGNFYVGDSGVNPGGNHSEGGRVARFDGRTGAFLGDFVAPGSGGLTHPGAIVFGPDSTGDGQLDLYATDEGPARVVLYDGVTGAFVREFVTSHSGGLSAPWGLTFGPDGNLYVASIVTRSVMRYQGSSGPTPGAPLPAPGNSGAYFVSTGSGGLLDVLGVLFGPDGNGDGQQDLYVTSNNFYNQGLINSKDGSVKRYDGQTGAFIDTFVASGSGGLRSTVLITFTETDPVTLAYTGATTMAASALPSTAAGESTAARSAFTVLNSNDAGAGSLRQAIVNPNAAPEADSIVLAPAVHDAIALTGGEVEQLEERSVPSASNGSYLLVSSYRTDTVLRFDAATGAFVDEFIPHREGKLNQPWGIVIGPDDDNVYVSTGHFQGPGQNKSVLRYDGATGAFLDDLIQRGQLIAPYAVTFGPDGNLYVGDRDQHQGRIARFDATTGAYLNDFVSASSGGLGNPSAHVFGPSGRSDGTLDLYVSDDFTGSILRYDGMTGAFVGVFVPNGSGGLGAPTGLMFGPDGNLYVSESGYFGSSPSVLRFQGPAGPMPGAFLDAFVPAGRGGLLQPFGVLFGPDHNSDGQQDLYVTSADLHESSFKTSRPHTSSVKVYDGVSGAYLTDFVAAGSGGLDTPILMTFTETDPVTLAYRSSEALVAASLPAISENESVHVDQAQSLVTETLSRWQASGADTSGLGNVQIRNTNLSGSTLGLAKANTIWLDDNAAGWGWFVDPTPWDDSEFTTPGDQGEQNRMDLLTVLAHEIGHVLGFEHGEPEASATGDIMEDTLAAGIRRMPGAGIQADWPLAIDLLLAEPPLSKRRR